MNRRIIVTATCAVLVLSSVAQPNNNNLTPPPHGQPLPADPNVVGTNAFLERERLTGDWGGYRASLEERGVDVGLAFWGDLFQNARGGANTADLDFMHVESLTVLVDTEKLFGHNGGRFFIDLQHIGGDNPSDNVGDWQWVSSLASDRRDEIAELWYEQRLMNDQVRIKLGKIEPCYDFDVSDVGGYFLNASSGLSPTIPGFPTYPDTAFGIVAEYAPSDSFYIRGGVFDGAGQEGKTLGDDGFRTVFSGPADLLLISEIGTAWSLGHLPGRAAFGITYHTGTFDRFDGGTDDGVASYYVVVDHMLSKESVDDEADDQGISAFFRAGMTDAETFDVRYHLGCGVVAKGLIADRNDDAFGVAVNMVGFSNDSNASFGGDEVNVELFYLLQVTPFFSVTPDVQYIVNPSGDDDLDDALAIGVRFAMTF